jgi:pimeloyl-ACP methyl ester carboxylesterase
VTTSPDSFSTVGAGDVRIVADRLGDLDGLRTNLRRRDGRWYWHWDPKFIDGASARPPIEVTEVDRLYAAVDAFLRADVPMLLVRGQMSDLVTGQRADEFLSRFPLIDFIDVGGAGHMVAGDRNDVFAGAVVDFLTRHAEDR